MNACLKVLARSLVASLLMLGSGAVCAHEGHEHDEAAEAVRAAPVPTSAVAVDAPRLALHSARLELVAVREDEALLIYVDDYLSNAPLAGLQLRVQSGERSVQAEEIAAGLYRLAPGVLGDDGALHLRIAVHGEGWEENLEGVLPPADEAETSAATDWRRAVLIAALVLLAIVLVAVLVRRRARAAG